MSTPEIATHTVEDMWQTNSSLTRIPEEMITYAEGLKATSEFPVRFPQSTHKLFSSRAQELWDSYHRMSIFQHIETAQIPARRSDNAKRVNQRDDISNLWPRVVSGAGLQTELDSVILLQRKLLDPEDRRGNADLYVRDETYARFNLGALADRDIDVLRNRAQVLLNSLLTQPNSYVYERYLKSIDEIRAATAAQSVLDRFVFTSKDQNQIENLVDTYQLDWEVLPQSDEESIKEIILRDITEAGIRNSDINWQRIETLIGLRNEFGGEIFRSKTKAFGSKMPYFVLVFGPNEGKIAIAETPTRDNATYIVREDISAGTWQEVLALCKAEAREVGAYRVIHEQDDTNHDQKLALAISDLLAM
ncbi:MAG: hypothetical protein WEC80_01850 [Patescibacteria group bacterium]